MDKMLQFSSASVPTNRVPLGISDIRIGAQLEVNVAWVSLMFNYSPDLNMKLLFTVRTVYLFD